MHDLAQPLFSNIAKITSTSYCSSFFFLSHFSTKKIVKRKKPANKHHYDAQVDGYYCEVLQRKGEDFYKSYIPYPTCYYNILDIFCQKSLYFFYLLK